MFYQLLYMVPGNRRPLSLQDRGDNCSTDNILEFYDFSLLHSDLSGFNHANDCSAPSGICKYVCEYGLFFYILFVSTVKRNN